MPGKKPESKENPLEDDCQIDLQVLRFLSEEYNGAHCEHLTSRKMLLSALGKQITIVDSSKKLTGITCSITFRYA